MEQRYAIPLAPNSSPVGIETFVFKVSAIICGKILLPEPPPDNNNFLTFISREA